MSWFFASRPKVWIPPYALAAGQLAHAASWLLLALHPWSSQPAFGMAELAWVHLVALGWLSLTSLAVLIHVIPGFLDVDWRMENVARWSILPFGVGVWLLVAGFYAAWPLGWLLGATLIALGLVGYLIPAFTTILSHRPEPGARAPLRTGFLMVLTGLVLAASLGVPMATTLAGHGWPWLLGVFPPVHALLGMGGWLTMLVFGVSTRIIFPVTGRRRHPLPRHAWVSALFTFGVIALLVGLFAVPGAAIWRVAGLVGMAGGVGVYLWDMGHLLIGAPNVHKPPIAFEMTALTYLCAAIVLAGLVEAGQSQLQAALVFVALVGWVGQSINGYLMHLGVRVLATMARGDEDETRPVELLVTPLSWAGFALIATAVALGTLGLLVAHGQWLRPAGVLGLLGWMVMMINVRLAWRKALASPG